jgi:hypothetical protein
MKSILTQLLQLNLLFPSVSNGVRRIPSRSDPLGFSVKVISVDK